MKTIHAIAASIVREYEAKYPRSTRSDEPMDVRMARALIDEHLQLTSTQELLARKTEEFDQLDEQCLAFIGEMMRQDRTIKVIEPIGWQATTERDEARNDYNELTVMYSEKHQRQLKIQKDLDDLVLHLVKSAQDVNCMAKNEALGVRVIVDRMRERIVELEPYDTHHAQEIDR